MRIYFYGMFSLASPSWFRKVPNDPAKTLLECLHCFSFYQACSTRHKQCPACGHKDTASHRWWITSLKSTPCRLQVPWQRAPWERRVGKCPSRRTFLKCKPKWNRSQILGNPKTRTIPKIFEPALWSLDSLPWIVFLVLVQLIHFQSFLYMKKKHKLPPISKYLHDSSVLMSEFLKSDIFVSSRSTICFDALFVPWLYIIKSSFKNCDSSY